jgi:exosortase
MPGVARKPAVWAVAALFLFVYLPTAVWLVERWSMGVWWHVHGFAVFPIASWLARKRLRALPPAPPSHSALGFLFLAPAVLLRAIDAMAGFELLSAVSLLLALPGLALLFLGRARTRAIWFPLLFLVFALPVPLVVARPIHLALRHVAAVGTAGVLDFLGYEVHRNGMNLQVGPEGIEIADSCSGFSTLLALLMVGLLLAYLARARWWRGALLAAWVVPAAAAANVVRCILLTMFAVAFGGDILATALHPLSGVFTFAAALGLLLGLERRLLGQRPC